MRRCRRRACGSCRSRRRHHLHAAHPHPHRPRIQLADRILQARPDRRRLRIGILVHEHPGVGVVRPALAVRLVDVALLAAALPVGAAVVLVRRAAAVAVRRAPVGGVLIVVDRLVRTARAAALVRLATRGVRACAEPVGARARPCVGGAKRVVHVRRVDVLGDQ